VEITNEYVAELRSFLTGEGDDPERIGRLQARDGFERCARRYGMLCATALYLAARRRFPGGYTDADVIRLVGRARVQFVEVVDIDPLAAEAAVREALGDPAESLKTDPQELGNSVLPLLIVLLEEDGITADRIDDFLAEVLPQAEAWLARRPTAPSQHGLGAVDRSAAPSIGG
jgi:hypothetical protein